ncbi:MAG: hypothetical protein V4671_11630 [Armatimonadota bacterium]
MQTRRSFVTSAARLVATGALGMIMIAGSGCGGGSGSQTTDAPNRVVTRGRYGALAFTLSVAKATFAAGEEIPFVFTITNTGSTTISYSVTDVSDYYLAGAIILQGETSIWKSGTLLGGPGSIAEDSIDPGETRSVTIIWDQRRPPTGVYIPGVVGEPGEWVSPGVYTIRAHALIGLRGVTDRETQLTVDPLQVTIQ